MDYHFSPYTVEKIWNDIFRLFNSTIMETYPKYFWQYVLKLTKFLHRCAPDKLNQKNPDYNNETIAMNAFKFYNREYIRYLIVTCKIDLSIVDDDGWTALAYAVNSNVNSTRLVILHLKRNNKLDEYLNMRDIDGDTLLLICAKSATEAISEKEIKEHIKIAKLLLAQGVDKDIVDEDNLSAYDYAIKVNEEFADLFRE